MRRMVPKRWKQKAASAILASLKTREQKAKGSAAAAARAQSKAVVQVKLADESSAKEQVEVNNFARETEFSKLRLTRLTSSRHKPQPALRRQSRPTPRASTNATRRSTSRKLPMKEQVQG